MTDWLERLNEEIRRNWPDDETGFQFRVCSGLERTEKEDDDEEGLKKKKK